MRMRVGLAGILVCAALTSCNRGAPEPRPDRVLEPSITQSSAMPTADKNNVACTLLTAEERRNMVGYSLNAEVPVRPDPGAEECIWVHSLRQPARSAVHVTALRTPVWARNVAPQIRAAIVRPTTSDALRAKLKAALADLMAGPEDLPTDEVCEVYLLLAESRGAIRSDEQVFYATIGAMPAAFGVACEDGIMTIAGYGEYGVRPSLALKRGVAKLAVAAGERAAEALADADAGDGESPSPEDGAGDEEDAASPEPSPTQTDDAEGQADSEDEDES